MFLLPGLAGDVYSKISGIKAFSFRGQSSAFEGRRKNGVRCIMLKQIKILRRTSPKPRNFLQPDILIVINKSSYGKLY